jgi:hypothetical protein
MTEMKYAYCNDMCACGRMGAEAREIETEGETRGDSDERN